MCQQKRADNTRGDTAQVTWRGWNNDGILRFNHLCKAVKSDRKKHSALNKTVLLAIDPEEKSQHSKKRKRKMPPVAKAFVDSDDDESEIETSEEDDEDSESESSSGKSTE